MVGKLNKQNTIKRSDLISKCNKFIKGKLTKADIEEYASNLIFSNDIEWDDDIISDIVFLWDNEEINFPINEVNMKVWKHRLETGEDLILDYNKWNHHIDKQKQICETYKSDWNPINKKLMVGCSSDLLKDPINGLRHPKSGNATGWYIWTGDYNASEDFFKPLCAEHLLQIRPHIIKYLGLDIGFRFLVDKNGYEDVWYDESIVNIE